jgi:hypothetical protein
MAASTVVFDNNSPQMGGNHHIVTGGSVLYINAHPTADHTDAPEFRLNMEDDGSTVSNGLVYIRTAAAQTVRFTAGVIF